MDAVCASVPGAKAAHTQVFVRRFSPVGAQRSQAPFILTALGTRVGRWEGKGRDGEQGWAASPDPNHTQTVDDSQGLRDPSPPSTSHRL